MRGPLSFGSCRLDRAMGLLHVDGEEVRLPPKALALLWAWRIVGVRDKWSPVREP